MCRNAISVCFRPVFDPSSKMLLAHMFYHLFLVIAELHVYPPDSATSASCFNFSIVNQRLFIPYSLICCRMDLLCSLTPSYLLKVILVCCFQRLDVWMFGRDRPCGGLDAIDHVVGAGKQGILHIFEFFGALYEKCQKFKQISIFGLFSKNQGFSKIFDLVSGLLTVHKLKKPKSFLSSAVSRFEPPLCVRRGVPTPPSFPFIPTCHVLGFPFCSVPWGFYSFCSPKLSVVT